MGFHQVELEPESRNITTFTTHVGLFRYKRLMFGISCAPEMYQQCIKMALEGCAGQRNISDDIIVYGCTQQEHDELDASPVGLGAILSQKQSDGNFRPVTFASRTLTDVEQRYSQTEREALAVVWGCERFHLYLYGKEFILVTDHKPLEVIYSPKSKPPARIERWAMRLQPYTFKVKYKPGPQNAADCLSRLSQVQDETTGRNIAEEYAYFVAQNAVPNAMTFKMIKDSANLDKDIKQILNGKISKSNNLFRFREELSVVDGVLLKGSRIVIPDRLRKQTLQLAHEGHQGKFVQKLPEIDAENRKDDADTRRKDFEMKEKGKYMPTRKEKRENQTLTNSSFVKKFNGQINEEKTFEYENIDNNIEDTNENEHTDTEVNLREDSSIPSRPKRDKKVTRAF
ncbi:unnamed protein product [Mytilus coruscus]|uniref:Reverse transcriptase RNase H-like domain-containing protein n=1 Tax=Mytilus coruscus TaxID=42192 RepID=A0A6J8C4V0_MYTCO|nr:unnamed protein product [Mytilus coruscus]